MELFILIAIIVFGGGISIILKKGSNEVISGMQSIDTRLKNIEKELEKK
ncbi:hypothetical protein [Carboxylicivirga linearis]|uniref:Preprotein translocase subunit TatA n=1 Tax=Carboxylicivirga linearis TaxID=1628157 RepID=A0ABS5K3M9_9BACT|nr:hypothetical protein [Carboxylicivirga linearis]MBS2101139.1 hypothetical protein [Carboxylicivirga linearis]